MNDHWHEQIQRHLNGQLGAEEAAAFVEALGRDAEMRALYLDYMNLDAALGAVAESAAAVPGSVATLPAEAEGGSWPLWRWLAPVAAGAALVVLGFVFERRGPVPARADLGAATLSAQTAISRLPTPAPAPIPAWMSPTASLLGEPGPSR
jgi:hypothetical protein